jgi:hypothetical protein
MCHYMYGMDQLADQLGMLWKVCLISCVEIGIDIFEPMMQ